MRSLKKYFFLLLFCIFSYEGIAQCPLTFLENNKEGLKSISGTIILPAIYNWIFISNTKGFVVLSKDNRVALANTKGELLTNFEYDWIEAYYSFGPFSVKKDNRCGFIDSTGKVIIPLVYEEAYRTGRHGEMITARKDGRSGILDLNGKILIPFEYDEISTWNFSEGLYPVKRGRLWGYIDTLNNLKIPFMYESARRFSEGLAEVAVPYDRWGFINKENKVIIPLGYGYYDGCEFGYYGFKNGRAPVCVNGNQDLVGYVNTKNEFVIQPKYDCLDMFEEGYASATIGEYFGYVDTLGTEFLFRKYNKMTPEWGPVKAPPRKLPRNTSSLSRELPETDHDSKSPKRYGSWTMEMMLDFALQALREEPKQYPRMSNLKQICIAYGIFMDGNYTYKFYREKREWQEFLTGTVFKIISNEKFRKSFYDWIIPYYKKCFETMHPFHKKAYKEIVFYLKEYMDNYDLARTVKFMEEDERSFAKRNYKGEIDPCRKLSAWVDRLIILHKVISVEDAKRWVNIVAKEVATWK